MNELPDEFEEYRARSYSGGFSPGRFRRNRIQNMERTAGQEGRGQKVLDWLEDCYRGKEFSSACDTPIIDVSAFSTAQCFKQKPRTISNLTSNIPDHTSVDNRNNNNNHIGSGLRDCQHLVRCSGNKNAIMSKVLSYSSPRIDRYPTEKQLLQVYFNRVNGLTRSTSKPCDTSYQHHLYQQHHHQPHHHYNHHHISTPQSAGTVPHWNTDLDGTMRPRLTSMPSKAPGARSPGMVQSLLTVPTTPLPADRPSSLQLYPLRKVRSFVIINNKLVKENDALICDSPPTGSMISRGTQSKDRMCRSGSMGEIPSGAAREEFRPFTSPPSGAAPKSLTYGRNNGQWLRLNADDREAYRVMLIGPKGVGKSAIVAQFLKPERSGYERSTRQLSQDYGTDVEDTDADEGSEQKNRASILLDGEEATLEFIDNFYSEDCATSTTDIVSESLYERIHDFKNEKIENISAFVVVYSVEDRKSYESAIDSLYELRNDEARCHHERRRQAACILVANKVDLVRNRVVSEQEGRSAAVMYDCKYIEVSAAIDHQIDELFIGILKQIRLIVARLKLSEASIHPPPSSRPHGGMDSVLASRVRDCSDCNRHLGSDSCCLVAARYNVLTRLLRGERRASKSCANLYVL